jgi:zinc D-Ala-D-Ala carboxypeptidase
MNLGAIEPDYLAPVMPPINKPFLFALRCIAVIICCLPLFPARAELAGPVFVDSSRSADSVAFAAAAEQNARLKFDLIWTFGAKPQRGWRLYTPLIRRLLDTDGAPETNAFAQALSDWQRSAGLPSTGVLDQQTWMKMVAVFQSRRIKDRPTPTPGQLTIVPASEFFDPERLESLRCVERQAYAAYKKLVAAAAADLSLDSNENWLKIISAFRSPAYQAQLRRQSPRSGRAGLAVNSPHFTGRALDLYVGGEPVSTNDQNRAVQVNTKVYQWLVRNAERFGFYPYFYEPWHWEYCPQYSTE